MQTENSKMAKVQMYHYSSSQISWCCMSFKYTDKPKYVETLFILIQVFKDVFWILCYLSC